MIATAQKTIADLNDGRGIQSVDVQYYLSASATALSGGSWSTTAPAWVNGKYMWSKTVTTYTDGGKKESTPACITGAKGATGSAGKGVSAIAEQYYLSTSKTSQTGGSWVTTPPAWSLGKYIWTRSAITYTDGTTTYTTPYCDASWEAVNEIEVGGRNLWINTINGTKDSPFHFESASTDGYYVYNIFGGKSIYTNVSFKAGEVITVQAKSSIPWSTNHGGGNSATNGKCGFWLIYSTHDDMLTGTWPMEQIFYAGDGVGKNFVKTLKVPEIDGLTDIYIGFRFNLYSDGTNILSADLFDLKLERGNVATDWTPAPEDYASASDLELMKTNVSAQIQTLSSSIRQEVSANYAASNDVVELGKKMQTLSEQTEQQFSWSTSEIETMKTRFGNAVEATEEQLRLIQTYMTFSQSGLTIGKTGNPFTFRVVNDRLAFFMNETEVAYLSNNKLYVTHAEILKSMRIGKFAFEPQTNGNLSLVYTG